MIDNNSNIDGSSEISAVIWYNEGLLYLFNSQYVQAIVAFGNAADIFEEKNRTKEYMVRHISNISNQSIVLHRYVYPFFVELIIMMYALLLNNKGLCHQSWNCLFCQRKL